MGIRYPASPHEACVDEALHKHASIRCCINALARGVGLRRRARRVLGCPLEFSFFSNSRQLNHQSIAFCMYARWVFIFCVSTSASSNRWVWVVKVLVAGLKQSVREAVRVVLSSTNRASCWLTAIAAGLSTQHKAPSGPRQGSPKLLVKSLDCSAGAIKGLTGTAKCELASSCSRSGHH